MATQTFNGKALEFAFLEALVNELHDKTQVQVISSPALVTAQRHFDNQEPEAQNEMMAAATVGVKNIISMEPKLANGNGVLELLIQADSLGMAGDVRDIVAIRRAENWETGISCKNNHSAVKHPRLSGTIDIGSEWFGIPSNAQYFNDVTPIFSDLGQMGQQGIEWKDVPNKHQDYYIPVLQAFMDEINRLDAQNPGQIPERLMRYLLGRHDFYKAISLTTRHTTEIQGFNLNGTLNQRAGTVRPLVNMGRVRLPSTIYNIGLKPGSSTTILISMDEGWGVSLRLHSAETIVKNSLKFDVLLTGVPPSMYRQTIGW